VAKGRGLLLVLLTTAVSVGASVVLAQAEIPQYPPATGEGGSRQGAATGTQTSPATPADPGACLRVAQEVNGTLVDGTVEEQGGLRASGGQSCAEPFSKIDVSIGSARTYLATAYAAEDGSYVAKATLPASITPGTHQVVANIEGRGELLRAVQVTRHGAPAAPPTATPAAAVAQTPSSGATNAGSAREGTRVLASTVTDPGSGLRPKTGRDLVVMLMWALILVVFAAVLVRTTRTGARRYGSVRAFGRRFGRTPHVPAALPPPEVPFIDTSRFVPYRSRTGPGPSSRDVRRSAPPAHGSTSSPWDAPQQSESPS
jgi:hypothetical protein